MNTDQFPESDSLSMPNDDLRIEFDAADLSVMVVFEGYDNVRYTVEWEAAMNGGDLRNPESGFVLLNGRRFSWLQAQQDYVEQWLEYWTEQKKGTT